MTKLKKDGQKENKRVVITVELWESDVEFMRNFMDEVRNFTGGIVEVFGVRTDLLLSPFFRNTLLRQGQSLEKMIEVVGLSNVYRDNLGDPLSVSNSCSCCKCENKDS